MDGGAGQGFGGGRERRSFSVNKKVSRGMFWKLMERFGVQGTQFVLQIILARLLDPAHYGTLSLMMIFVSLANVFIQQGFNTALIQNKDVTEEDYSSVFWVTLGIATLAYVLLYAFAPMIARLYEMPDLVWPFRALMLRLFPGALYSVQLARVSRDMNFKKVFTSSVVGSLIAGFTGILIALLGGGLWALVIHSFLNTAIACVIMLFSIHWRILPVCNLARVKVLFAYGWKLLVSGLVSSLYQDIRSLVIGLKYDSSTLGYYNRGRHFPQFLIKIINTTVSSVMLPAMSARQDERERLKSMMRKSIRLSAYIIFPMMAGLAAVGEPLVRLLLTDKWLPAVPYLQICCLTLAFNPMHSCNLQAINAIGRSDYYLKLELIKKGIALAVLALVVILFDSPLAIAASGILTTAIEFFVNAGPNRRLVDYSYREQILDFLPPLLASGLMFVLVAAITLLGWGVWLTLVVQVVAGVALYAGWSLLFRVPEFYMLLDTAKQTLHKTE